MKNTILIGLAPKDSWQLHGKHAASVNQEHPGDAEQTDHASLFLSVQEHLFFLSSLLMYDINLTANK